MKILTAAQIRAWDEYTISHEPIRSLILMERAASACVDWIMENYHVNTSYHIFCGKGNNGGDGLVIARLLWDKGASVIVHIVEFGHIGTEDFQTNLGKLHHTNVDILFIQDQTHFHLLQKEEIIIDALLGSGLNRPLDGIYAALVAHLNQSEADIISIDIPSGLSADQACKNNTVIKATHTLSFQCYKTAFLLPENDRFVGQVHILDIGLLESFYDKLETKFTILDRNLISAIRKKRNKFSHKGDFGHALIVAGSFGKMGAAVLSAKACLRSGVGLLTCHIPKSGYDIMQISVPEAMIEIDFNTSFNTKLESDFTAFKVIGIGPGIGISSETATLLKQIFSDYHSPLVLDADALNLISLNPELFSLIPKGSILTPHPKEFERLFGKTNNDFERLDLALEKAKAYNIIIVMKGKFSFIASPEGQGFFNPTGNPGMATAGSGDVLTGILTGFLAQGYSSLHAALLGVYLHGLAGDMASQDESLESLIASDIISNLSQAFRFLQKK